MARSQAQKDAAAAKAAEKAAAEAAQASATPAAPAAAPAPTPEPAEPKAGKSKDVAVYSPNRQYTGITAGVSFVDGNGIIPADTENIHHLVGWFKDHGYTTGKPPADDPSE
jgi:hypothetical protein